MCPGPNLQLQKGARCSSRRWHGRWCSWLHSRRVLLLDVATCLLGNVVLLGVLSWGLRENCKLARQLTDGYRILLPKVTTGAREDPYGTPFDIAPGSDVYHPPELPYLWLDIAADILFLVVHGVILLWWCLLRVAQLRDYIASTRSPWPEHYLVRPAQIGMGLAMVLKKFGLLWSCTSVHLQMVYHSRWCPEGFIEDGLLDAFAAMSPSHVVEALGDPPCVVPIEAESVSRSLLVAIFAAWALVAWMLVRDCPSAGTRLAGVMPGLLMAGTMVWSFVTTVMLQYTCQKHNLQYGPDSPSSLFITPDSSVTVLVAAGSVLLALMHITSLAALALRATGGKLACSFVGVRVLVASLSLNPRTPPAANDEATAMDQPLLPSAPSPPRSPDASSRGDAQTPGSPSSPAAPVDGPPLARIDEISALQESLRTRSIVAAASAALRNSSSPQPDPEAPSPRDPSDPAEQLDGEGEPYLLLVDFELSTFDDVAFAYYLGNVQAAARRVQAVCCPVRHQPQPAMPPSSSGRAERGTLGRQADSLGLPQPMEAWTHMAPSPFDSPERPVAVGGLQRQEQAGAAAGQQQQQPGVNGSSSISEAERQWQQRRGPPIPGCCSVRDISQWATIWLSLVMVVSSFAGPVIVAAALMSRALQDGLWTGWHVTAMLVGAAAALPLLVAWVGVLAALLMRRKWLRFTTEGPAPAAAAAPPAATATAIGGNNAPGAIGMVTLAAPSRAATAAVLASAPAQPAAMSVPVAVRLLSPGARARAQPVYISAASSRVAPAFDATLATPRMSSWLLESADPLAAARQLPPAGVQSQSQDVPGV